MLRKNMYSRHNNMYILLIAICSAIVLTFIFMDSRLRPQVSNLARYRVQSMITSIANQTIMDEIEKNQVDYDKLITIHQNENGDVTFLSYNAIEVNKLKSKITSAVIENINSLEETQISIPLANIFDIDIFQNKGPRLKFTIIPAAYVETDLESEFENTGINQVSHKIFIVMKVNATALVPNFSSNIYFETRMCVAQTIIIGNVPNNISEKLFQISE